MARPGDLVFKPRDEWHTFWNAGETPARLLEIISPGGLEELFRWLDRLGAELSPQELEQKIGPYGCAADMGATMATRGEARAGLLVRVRTWGARPDAVGRGHPTVRVKRRGLPSCAAPETSGCPSGRTSSYGNA